MTVQIWVPDAAFEKIDPRAYVLQISQPKKPSFHWPLTRLEYFLQINREIKMALRAIGPTPGATIASCRTGRQCIGTSFHNNLG